MELKETLCIAVGHTAKSKIWKNKEITWTDLVARLRETRYTGETLKEYLSATKDEQARIKDVGGFVGGYLNGGRRKPENVLSRSVLTLDLDFAKMDFWEGFTLLFEGTAAVLHGTHKHSQAAPRLRLVVPLDRETTSEEYTAIARAVAGRLGIDAFDDTTFQPYRLMYWPSTPRGEAYYFEEQQGEPLSADMVLSWYRDWRDVSAWPTSSRVAEALRIAGAKQEDPETKRGVIGAFCRTYTIEQAIENFLSAQYTDAGEGRYTFTGGSAAGGLVVYENKFAYSHHGTDPAGGKLCNAFDLVRVHLFGHLDTDDSTPSRRAAEAFALEQADVRETIAHERLEAARYDFADGYEPPTAPTTDAKTGNAEDIDPADWLKDLEVDNKGKYTNTAQNITLILRSDPNLRGLFRQNTFDGRPYIDRSAPWRVVRASEPVKNVDFSGVRNYVETVYGIAAPTKIDDAVALELERNSYHPVREMLSGLTWDGVPRIDRLLIDFFGTPDTVYNREVIRKTLVGAVARIFRPGVKFDTVLTLIGTQGDGKSTFIATLGGAWFSDSFSTVLGKEAFEQLRGAWLVEIPELAGIKRAEVESVKHFLSKQTDTYRPAYGRVLESFPRQCVFIATTNQDDFLRDTTGNRRFWPVATDPSQAPRAILPLGGELVAEVPQVWAEAVALYKAGEPLILSAEAQAGAKVAQREHMQRDERAGLIESYLNMLLPTDWDARDIYDRRAWVQGYTTDAEAERANVCRRREYVCTAEVWAEALGKNRDDLDRYKAREINEILRTLEGWSASVSTRNFSLYGKQKFYQRKPQPETPAAL